MDIGYYSGLAESMAVLSHPKWDYQLTKFFVPQFPFMTKKVIVGETVFTTIIGLRLSILWDMDLTVASVSTKLGGSWPFSKYSICWEWL